MTKEEHDELLRKIMETGGATPEMEESIQKLRDEFDEREGMLKKDGETYDKETYDKVLEERDEYKRQVEEEKKRYINRFFQGKKEEIIDDVKKDVKKDDKELSFDELFEKVED